MRTNPQSFNLPLVSIGIPTFNRGATIGRALDSVLAQDYPNIEVIISDNASTDNTGEICATYAKTYPNISLTVQEKNKGPTNNFIEVLSLARGDMFMWLGDDDRLDPDYVSTCVKALMGDTSLAMAGGCAKYYRDGAEAFAGFPTNLHQHSPLARMRKYYSQVGDNGIFYAVMQRKFAANNRLRNCMGGDWLFIAAMAYQGKIQSVPCFVHRDLEGTSASKKKIAKTLGISNFSASFRYLFIAVDAFLDVWRRNPAFKDVPAAKRFLYALAVFAQIFFSKTIVLNGLRFAGLLVRRLLGENVYQALYKRMAALILR